MTMARRLVAVAVVLMLSVAVVHGVVLDSPLPKGSAQPQPSSNDKTTTSTPSLSDKIKNIVVLMLENRSFVRVVRVIEW